MLKKSYMNKKGVSLIEVIVATALIAIVISGFINMFYYSANLRTNSQKRLSAVLAAESLLEEVRASRGEAAASWSNVHELREWLMDIKGFSETTPGILVKDDIYITLTDTDTENLFELKVEAVYEDELHKGSRKAAELDTRLRELGEH